MCWLLVLLSSHSVYDIVGLYMFSRRQMLDDACIMQSRTCQDRAKTSSRHASPAPGTSP